MRKWYQKWKGGKTMRKWYQRWKGSKTMREMLIVILLLSAFMLALTGCGGPGPEPERKFTMVIKIAGQAAGQAGALGTRELPVGESWFVPKPENGYTGTIGRDSANELFGSVTAYAVIKDEFGVIVDPVQPDQISWTSPDSEVFGGVGQAIGWGGSSQMRFTLHAEYNGQIMTDEGYQDVSLSADALCLLSYRNAQPYEAWYTPYFSFTQNNYVTVDQAELYRTDEDGVIYLNAPYGIAKIIDREPGTELWIIGCVKSVPEGLTFINKLPLTEYGVYIVRLAGGGYAKMICWSASGGIGAAFGLWLNYSTSPDTNFSVSW